MSVGFILLMCIIVGLLMILGASLGVILLIVGIVGLGLIFWAAQV